MFGLHVLVDRKSSPIVFGCKCFIAWIKWIYELILTYKASHGVFEIVPEFVLFAIQMPILLKVSKEEQCREPPSPSPGASPALEAVSPLATTWHVSLFWLGSLFPRLSIWLLAIHRPLWQDSYLELPMTAVSSRLLMMACLNLPPFLSWPLRLVCVHNNMWYSNTVTSRQDKNRGKGECLNQDENSV